MEVDTTITKRGRWVALRAKKEAPEVECPPEEVWRVDGETAAAQSAKGESWDGHEAWNSSMAFVCVSARTELADIVSPRRISCGLARPGIHGITGGDEVRRIISDSDVRR